MKKRILQFSAILGLCLVAVIGIAQVQADDDDDKKKKKKVEKTIEVIEDNGITKVTITTIEDGKKTVKVYEGDEAKEFLHEHHMGHDHEGEHEMDIQIKIDGMDFLSELDFDGKSAEEIRDLIMKHMEEFKGDHDFDFDFDFDILDSGAFQMHMHTMDIDSIHDHMMKMMKIHIDGDEIMIGDGDIKMDSKVIIIGDDGEMSEEEMKELEEMGVHIEIDESEDATVKKMVIARVIRIEDVENEKGQKPLEIESFSLYPNPNDGQFRLKFEVEDDKPTNITVMDMTGKEIFNKTVKGSGEHVVDLDLSEKDKGVYMLNLTQGKRSQTKKIILQ